MEKPRARARPAGKIARCAMCSPPSASWSLFGVLGHALRGCCPLSAPDAALLVTGLMPVFRGGRRIFSVLARPALRDSDGARGDAEGRARRRAGTARASQGRTRPVRDDARGVAEAARAAAVAEAAAKADYLATISKEGAPHAS